MSRTRIIVETGGRRVFVSAVDWPGWCRGGKGEAAALEAFAAAEPRYRQVAAEAGLSLPVGGASDLDVVERLAGTGGTDFGVPSVVAGSDRQPVDGAEAERLASLVAAAWVTFDRVAAGAPAELRKGPRGGGRDTAKIVDHVVGADGAYAHEMGLAARVADPADRAAVEAMRAAMLDAIRGPSDGSPLGGRRWPPRYAARRIAWHALDHAWEIEDRSEPA
jgi:hypothetical protein